ncbi:hypothetical protein D3C76_1619190 [compost metagenome]
MHSSTEGDTLMSRPCSSHVYHVLLTPASCATSSRLRPGVRLRVPSGSPTAAGVSAALRDLRNPDNACNLVSLDIFMSSLSDPIVTLVVIILV